jgi:hypothetical protein
MSLFYTLVIEGSDRREDHPPCAEQRDPMWSFEILLFRLRLGFGVEPWRARVARILIAGHMCWRALRPQT